MISQKTVICNATGLHARPAADFVRAAKGFAADIQIRRLGDKAGGPQNAKSIISVLSLGLTKGAPVEVLAAGEDEEKAVQTLVGLIDSGFGEN